MNEELKQNWIKISVLALVFFLVSYLAFCLTLKHHIKKLNSPFYQMQRMEKMLEKQNKDFDKFVKSTGYDYKYKDDVNNIYNVHLFQYN